MKGAQNPPKRGVKKKKKSTLKGAYNPQHRLMVTGDLSNNRSLRAKKTKSKGGMVKYNYRIILCDEKQEDHEEDHQDEEYLDHQPPVGGYAVEVLEKLALRSLDVRQRVVHVLVDPIVFIF